MRRRTQDARYSERSSQVDTHLLDTGSVGASKGACRALIESESM